MGAARTDGTVMAFGRSRNNSNSNGKKKNEAEHTSGARPSTEQTHQEGQTRRQKDQGGRKAHKAGRVKVNPNTANGRAAAAAKKAEKKKGTGRG